MISILASERFWVEKSRFENAERQYYEYVNKECHKAVGSKLCETIYATDIAKCDLAEISKLQVEIDNKQKGVIKPKKKRSKTLKVAVEETLLSKNNFETSSMHQCTVPIETAESKSKKGKKKSKVTAAKKILQEKSTNLPMASNDSIHFAVMTPKMGSTSNNQCTLVSEIAKAREHIKNSLEKMDGIATLAATPVSSDVLDRIIAIENDNADLKKLIESLRSVVMDSQKRIAGLELQAMQAKACAAAPASSSNAGPKEADDDDGVDLFASDSEEESADATRVREQRLAAYAAKKSKKPALIAKSSLVLDVKPWDDETDLKLMETEIRKISSDGLLWGASRFVPVAFGIQKLSISCVVEDDKVSIDCLSEEIESLKDYVQSVDVAAFNKI